MTMPLYASPEQLMRERSELARKGIARGRSVVVLKYVGGVLFVAENPSTTLHKVSEIYDRIGFAAVGRYSEFESLRKGGIRHVDLQGYSYDRRDVSARQLANVYAQTLGTIFTEQLKPFEVEICVAEVGSSTEEDQLYRLTYDGSIGDEPRHVVMGGQADTISTKLKETYEEGMDLAAALAVAVGGLRATSSGGNGDVEPSKLEVAVLDRERPGRTFRRINGSALAELLPAGPAKDDDAGDEQNGAKNGEEAEEAKEKPENGADS
ncbi:proteasome subunit alpha [Amycolatopsis cihanbeyliensis]|uniref:Proteasome subunit alpha n=1 Tax=Amycolatopsis cihanbeyliensis TaxID=1128664 RepID=A0A542DCC1_AMYCI|nr:proteasome subunit alpha [Amycolatopsis cihanbeyliensis]TQJ00728.1 proteasome alpha subunit [Amycolatopsis cihanbeyliensis]